MTSRGDEPGRRAGATSGAVLRLLELAADVLDGRRPAALRVVLADGDHAVIDAGVDVLHRVPIRVVALGRAVRAVARVRQDALPRRLRDAGPGHVVGAANLGVR